MVKTTTLGRAAHQSPATTSIYLRAGKERKHRAIAAAFDAGSEPASR